MFVFFTSLVSCLFIQKHEERSFVSWMRQNNLIYTGDEYHLRLGIFLTNQRFIKSFKGSFKIGLNKFAATTPSEYRSLLGMNPSLSRQTERKSFVYQADPPKQLDWRQ